MIVEMRTYTFHPGALPVFLEAYQSGPLELQRAVLGNLLGYFVGETGILNQSIHLWGYESLEDRANRRRDLATKLEWREFLSEIVPLLVRQESRLLIPTEFSPVR